MGGGRRQTFDLFSYLIIGIQAVLTVLDMYLSRDLLKKLQAKKYGWIWTLVDVYYKPLISLMDYA